MHYIPGTPWFAPNVAELELLTAAGHIKPAAPIAMPWRPFRPLLTLAGLLSLEFALVSVVLWLA